MHYNIIWYNTLCSELYNLLWRQHEILNLPLSFFSYLFELTTWELPVQRGEHFWSFKWDRYYRKVKANIEHPAWIKPSDISRGKSLQFWTGTWVDNRQQQKFVLLRTTFSFYYVSLRNLLICYINVFSQEPLNWRHFLFCSVCFLVCLFAAFRYYLQTFQDTDSTILSRSFCEKKQSLELSFNKFRKREQTKLIKHQW